MPLSQRPVYLCGPANANGAPAPAAPTATAPAPAFFSRSRLLSRPSSDMNPPFRALAECAAREAGDETVEERVVDEGERNARDQDRGHDPRPVVEVAANEIRRHADRQRPVGRAGDERDRVHELVDDEREREDDDSEDPGDRDRRVDDDQRPQAVAEVQVLRDDARQREEEQRWRHEIREEDPDAEPSPDAAGEPRECIARGHRDRERDQHDHQADEARVAQPAQVVGVVEEVAVVRKRRAEAPHLRRVVHLRLVLERSDAHPHEREREHDREGDDDSVRERLLPPRVRHVTSARRAKKSIAIVTNASSGSMKSATAAPSPMLPALIPVWNASVVSTCVELNGPPFVRMYGTTMSVAVNTIPNNTATIAIGSCSGSETYQNFFRPVAPSIAAASSTSCGMDEIPARKMTVANGIIRQAWTLMIDDAAARGVPNHVGTLPAETRCE